MRLRDLNMNYNSLNEIKKLAISSLLVKDPRISFLAEGYNNYVYLIEEENNKLVLKLKKNNEPQFKDSLERKYVFLRYFESKGINFCPKAVFYDEGGKFSIEKLIEGKKIPQKDFTEKQIDLFVKQLYDLFSLNVSEFFNFCKDHRFKKFEYENPIESLNKYGFNRFNYAKKGNISKDAIEWMENKLDENLQYLSQSDTNIKQLGFSWGDIKSNVFIDDLGNMTFYNFDYVSIAQSPGLAYIKIHGGFNDSQFDYLIDRYSYYFKKDRKTALKEIIAEEKIIRVNDVVWAAMKWAETKEDKFKNLTYERMKLVG